MKMRQETSEAAESKKKSNVNDDDDDDVNDNESIESVSDDEFDKYLGKFEFRILIRRIDIETRLRYLSLIKKKN